MRDADAEPEREGDCRDADALPVLLTDELAAALAESDPLTLPLLDGEALALAREANIERETETDGRDADALRLLLPLVLTEAATTDAVRETLADQDAERVNDPETEAEDD